MAALLVVGAILLWVTPSRQTSSAQDAARQAPPLISRGYTDAPSGTAIIAGDPQGGGVLIELKIADGQKVKKGEVIAVPARYSACSSWGKPSTKGLRPVLLSHCTIAAAESMGCW